MADSLRPGTHYTGDAPSMRQSKSIQKLSAIELSGRHSSESSSWHDQYKDSPYIYIGGLPFGMNEGDIRVVFSQYGTVTEINLVRDQETGSSRGFAFLRYADQRSTVLAVDNLNGITLGQRTLQVDHVQKYRSPDELKAEREAKQKHRGHGGKYASLVTEDVFRTALGEYLTKPEDTERTVEPTGGAESKVSGAPTSPAVDKPTIKRPRTEAERELRRKFKEGELSLQEYEVAKDTLKRELKRRT